MREQRWGPGGWISRNSVHLTPVMKHWTPYGGCDGQGWVLLTKDGNCHSSCHRAIGKYMATRSQRAPSCSAGKAVSQRRSVEAWVAEGTEVLISTVAVRFVFYILGFILRVRAGGR